MSPAETPPVVLADPAGVAAAAAVVRRGGVLAYPTETVYGLGGDARLAEPLARIRALKGRDADKPVLVLTDTWARVAGWLGDLEGGLVRLMQHEPPLPVTLLLPVNGTAPGGLVGPGGKVGIRRTTDAFCRAVIAAADTVLLSTSANPAGRPAPALFADLDPSIRAGVDLAVDAGRPLNGVPSTVALMDEEKLVVVREGAVPTEVLLRILDEQGAG